MATVVNPPDQGQNDPGGSGRGDQGLSRSSWRIRRWTHWNHRRSRIRGTSRRACLCSDRRFCADHARCLNCDLCVYSAVGASINLLGVVAGRLICSGRGQVDINLEDIEREPSTFSLRIES